MDVASETLLLFVRGEERDSGFLLPQKLPLDLLWSGYMVEKQNKSDTNDLAAFWEIFPTLH